jgi:hypothetical protein
MIFVKKKEKFFIFLNIKILILDYKPIFTSSYTDMIISIRIKNIFNIYLFCKKIIKY